MKAMNASGRDDTSLANGVLNGLAMFMSLAAALHGVTIAGLERSHIHSSMNLIRLGVSGDDSLAGIPMVADQSAFLSILRRNIASFGFEAKAFISDRPHDAVFLGARPIHYPGGWAWARTLGRSTYKLGWSLCRPTEDGMAKITGIADMVCRTSPGVPILYDLANKILQLRKGAKCTPVPEDERSWLVEPNQHSYTDDTLEQLSQAYTRVASANAPWDLDCSLLTVHSLKGLIKDIEAIEQLPAVIDNPTWRLLVLLDEL